MKKNMDTIRNKSEKGYRGFKDTQCLSEYNNKNKPSLQKKNNIMKLGSGEFFDLDRYKSQTLENLTDDDVVSFE